MKPADVLVLNNIGGGFDILVKRLPNPHETIMMKHMHLTEDLAKGGNVAVALARLGISCTIIGKIGDDEAGRRDLDWMQAAGVDTSEVLVSSDVATGQGIGIIADNGDNILITGESSSEKLTWEEVQAAMLRRRGAGYFITGLEVRMPLVLRAAQLARQLGMRVMFNPSPVPEGGLPAPLYYVDDFFVNEVEAKLRIAMPHATVGATYEGPALSTRMPSWPACCGGGRHLRCARRVRGAACALPARARVSHAGRKGQLLPGRAAFLFHSARACHSGRQLRRRRRLPCRRGGKPCVGQASAGGLPLGGRLFCLRRHTARMPARLCGQGHC